MDQSQRPHQFAKWVSRIFHPFFIAILTLILATFQSGESTLSVLIWVSISVLIVIFPVSLYILIMVRGKKYTDLNVSIREHRQSLYLVATLCLVVLVIVLAVNDPPTIITACIYSGVLANLVGMVINRFTKISVHSAAMAGCTTVLFVFSPVIGVLMILTSLVTGWARMQLKAHSISQVILGYLVASSSVLISFRYFGLI